MAHASGETEEEFKLAQIMKKEYCDVSGKETNPVRAAEILHQIGLIYRSRSPDKTFLIKSAGLLNAAIVRSPLNVSQIEFDLSKLCQHILQMTGAKVQNVDLIKQGKEVKLSITKLRNEVKEFLDKVPRVSNNDRKENSQNINKEKIVLIEKLNKMISEKCKQVLVKLSKFCEDVMGNPPCAYAIAGMGSLAREEITPYSDFEHIILLYDGENYKCYLEYFRWLSVIFHIIILNVQESIIPSLNICSLNDQDSDAENWFYDAITPRGISFNGMMPHACKFPLGRQRSTKIKKFTTELVKPAGEMLNYLSSKADLKNGYHLADILTKVCFVFGSENIFKQFKDGAQKYLETKSNTDTIMDIQQQVKEDLNNFSTRFRLTNLKTNDTINIKQLVYRSTTLFISALARKHNIQAKSSFDAINEMVKSNKITQTTAKKLRCELQLRAK